VVNRMGLDVICAGMYRACSTWQYEVAAHLVEEHGGGRRLGYLLSGQYTALLAEDGARGIADSGEREGFRVIKAHEGERAMARELKARRACALYAFRDVRDVVYSLMHKRGKSFEQILRQGMIHQILANDRFWMAQPNVLVQRYEDLISEPARGVTELASHLGFRLEAGEAERIAALYSQESNRARTEALKQQLEQAGVDLESGGNSQICDPSSLLHWNHMRGKGAASWRTLATPRQIAVLHRLCGRWLESHGYSLEGQPSLKWDLSMTGLRASIQGEVDLTVGYVNFLVRTTSLRFPKTARTVKRLLGMPVEANAGATVWADPIPARSHSADVSGDAA
jgi:Sulfotransferase domain